MSAHLLTAMSDPLLPLGDRVAVPPWVIVAVGVAIVVSGVAYFAVQARRHWPRTRR
jgi:hypothetical protein